MPWLWLSLTQLRSGRLLVGVHRVSNLDFPGAAIFCYMRWLLGEFYFPKGRPYYPGAPAGRAAPSAADLLDDLDVFKACCSSLEEDEPRGQDRAEVYTDCMRDLEKPRKEARAGEPLDKEVVFNCVLTSWLDGKERPPSSDASSDHRPPRRGR